MDPQEHSDDIKLRRAKRDGFGPLDTELEKFLPASEAKTLAYTIALVVDPSEEWLLEQSTDIARKIMEQAAPKVELLILRSSLRDDKGQKQVYLLARENPPLVNPAWCSIGELQEIIENDPTCSSAYERELDRRLAKQAEVDHWEERLSG